MSKKKNTKRYRRLATTARRFEELKKGVPSGPDDLVIGRAIKGWENITWTVATTGKVIVNRGDV